MAMRTARHQAIVLVLAWATERGSHTFLGRFSRLVRLLGGNTHGLLSPLNRQRVTELPEQASPKEPEGDRLAEHSDRFDFLEESAYPTPDNTFFGFIFCQRVGCPRRPFHRK